jgi:hypothetical protein
LLSHVLEVLKGDDMDGKALTGGRREEGKLYHT